MMEITPGESLVLTITAQNLIDGQMPLPNIALVAGDTLQRLLSEAIIVEPEDY